MNKEDFAKEYHAIVQRVSSLHAKALHEGFLSMEDELDKSKCKKRDILEYGLQLALDYFDDFFVDGVLSNIIDQEQEMDADWKALKNVQKEAVIGILRGLSREQLKIILNSCVPIEMAV